MPRLGGPAKRRLSWWLLPALVLTACPRRIPPPAERVVDLAALIAGVQSAQAKLTSIRGSGHVTYQGPDRKGSAAALIAAQVPAQLHLELLDFFGRPALQLVCDGTRFGLYDAESGVFYRGPATGANLSRFLPVQLEPADLVASLLGHAPLPQTPTGGSVTLDEKGGQYVAQLELAGGHAERVWLPTDSRLPSRVELSGPQGYWATFEDRGGLGVDSLPVTLHLALSAARASVAIRYREVTANQALPASLFQLTPPANAKVIELDGEGNPLPSPGP